MGNDIRKKDQDVSRCIVDQLIFFIAKQSLYLPTSNISKWFLLYSFSICDVKKLWFHLSYPSILTSKSFLLNKDECLAISFNKYTKSNSCSPLNVHKEIFFILPNNCKIRVITVILSLFPNNNCFHKSLNFLKCKWISVIFSIKTWNTSWIYLG